jgi:hypothetical protein
MGCFEEYLHLPVVHTIFSTRTIVEGGQYPLASYTITIDRAPDIRAHLVGCDPSPPPPYHFTQANDPFWEGHLTYDLGTVSSGGEYTLQFMLLVYADWLSSEEIGRSNILTLKFGYIYPDPELPICQNLILS